MKYFLLLIAIVITIPELYATRGEVKGYQTLRHQGFTLYISQEAEVHTKELKEGLSLIKIRLNSLKRGKLSKTILSQIQSIPIFVEWNLGSAGAMYHPDKAWLINNGYIPEKENSIEITNLQNFNAWTKLNQPHILTHEFAHAYMDEFVTPDKQREIKDTFEQVAKNGLYKSVEYTPGGTMQKVQKKAYALTNELEYFAEISEAYIGKNDFFPYTRKDLKIYDPLGYELMRSIWK